MFQWLLTRYLQQAAHQHVYATVEEAVRQHMQGAAEEASAAPEPCEIAVIFALDVEAGGFVDTLDETGGKIQGAGFTVQSAALDQRALALVISGVGPAAAAQATAAVIDVHRPAWVVSAGFAGALHADLPRGAMLMADEIVDGQGTRLRIDFKISPDVVAKTPGLHVGRLLTVNELVAEPEAKLALGKKHDALAVDMESWAVAEVCRQRRTRLLSVRIISDAVEDRLPPEVDRLLKQKSNAARVGAALGALWERPGSAKDFYNLKERALVHSDRLARFLRGVLAQLPGHPPTEQTSPPAALEEKRPAEG